MYSSDVHYGLARCGDAYSGLAFASASSALPAAWTLSHDLPFAAGASALEACRVSTHGYALPGPLGQPPAQLPYRPAQSPHAVPQVCSICTQHKQCNWLYVLAICMYI